MDAIVVVVGSDYPRVRQERRVAMRMPGSAVGRRGMQLRAFNEVSRLAADSTWSEAAQRNATRRDATLRRELAFHLVSESIIPSILPSRPHSLIPLAA